MAIEQAIDLDQWIQLRHINQAGRIIIVMMQTQ